MNSKVPRMRTLKEALKDIMREDTNSSLTLYAIRQLVKNNEISHICRGNKFLINYDELIDYLNIKNFPKVSAYTKTINYNSITDNTELTSKRTSRFKNI